MMSLRPFLRSFPFVVCALLAALPASPSLGAVKVLESDARHVVLEVVPDPVKSESVTTSGGSYVRLRIHGFGAWGEAGAPEIPVASERVAIPPNAVPRLVVREEEWTEPKPGAIVPVGERVGVREPFSVNHVVEREPKLSEAFRSRAAVPERAFELSGIAGLRSLRTVSVVFHGASADMANRSYRLLKRAVLEVVFDEKAPDLGDPSGGLLGAPRRMAAPDDLWHRTVAGTVANAARAQAWSAGGPGDGTIVGDAPWGSGDQWKILVPGTGMASIAFDALAASGFPAGVDVDHLALVQRTFDLQNVDDPGTAANALFVALPVPIRMNDANSNGTFDAGDSFQFYGRSFRDQWMVSGQENEDLFGKNNFVWLRIDPAGGTRMPLVRPGGSLSGTATDSLASTTSPILVEKDVRYYERPPDAGQGARSFEAEFYFRNDGRSAADSALGWILQSDSEEFDAFDVADPVPGGAGTLTIRVIGGGRPADNLFTTRFESTLNEVSPPIAQKSFYNDALYVGGIVPPANVLHSFSIPAGILVNGSNRFSFRGWSYRGSSVNPNFLFPNTRFFFDWFQVSYARRLLARGDALSLSTAGGAAANLLVRVGGFTGTDLRLFDVTNPAAPAEVGVDAPTQVLPDGGTFMLLFDHDNTTGPGSYVAIRAGAIPPVASASITRISPPTLLAGGLGARWVGLAHESLLPGTQELAAYRATRMSAIAVPVSQVYDTFNNGMRDPRAIKAYSAYAFHRWSDPIAFLCLVGDASEDHLEILSESDPDLVPSHSLYASYEGAPEETDQYYAEVTHGDPADPDGFDDVPDLYVGRLAVNTAEELAWNIERIQRYESPETGSELWRQSVVLSADDAFSGDLGIGFSEGYRYQGNETGFRESSDAYADTLAALPFDAVVPTKVYVSDFTMGCPDSCYANDASNCENDLGRDCGIWYDCRNPDWVVEYQCMRVAARAAYLPVLRETLERGTLIWNFEGHANKFFMTHEEVFRDDTFSGYRDVNDLNNLGKPFIFLGFACHLAEFDNADEVTTEDCISEKLMNRRGNEDIPGGAIASFASSGFEFLQPNLYYNELLFDCFFHPERTMSTGTLPDGPGAGGAYVWTLGETTTRSRLLYQNAYPPNPFNERDRQASQRFVLLGDPAVTPDSGTPEIRVTVNGVPAASGQYLNVPDNAPIPVQMEASIQHGRGVTGLRIVDSQLGEVPASDYAIAVADSSEHGVTRAMTLTYTHPLRAADYDLTIEATNERGAVGRFLLRVSLDLRIEDLTPFPNPFADEMRLYYKLTRDADQVRARIFTVSGRKIYESNEAPARADVNAFVWNGRDDAGNEVANGTYLLTLHASHPEGDAEARARIVKMR